MLRISVRDHSLQAAAWTTSWLELAGWILERIEKRWSEPIRRLNLNCNPYVRYHGYCQYDFKNFHFAPRWQFCNFEPKSTFWLVVKTNVSMSKNCIRKICFWVESNPQSLAWSICNDTCNLVSKRNFSFNVSKKYPVKFSKKFPWNCS